MKTSDIKKALLNTNEESLPNDTNYADFDKTVELKSLGYYKLYIFDFDLTIADTTKTAEEAYKKAITECGGKFNASNLLNYLSVPLKETYEKFCDKTKYTMEIFQEKFYSITHNIIANTAKLYPDVIDNLTMLKKYNKKLAIVTNRDFNSIQLFLTAFELTDLFSVIICKEDVKNQKPSAEPLNKCLERINNDILDYGTISKAESIYIGDAENDMVAAKNAGIDFLYIRRLSDTREELQNVNKITTFNIFKDELGFRNSQNQKIKKFIEQLSSDIKAKKFIVVIGRNLSLPQKNYDEEIIKKIKSFTEKEDSFYSICDQYYKIYGSKAFVEILKSVCPNEAAPLRVHDILCNMNFVSYISFCYDSLLLKSFKKNKNKKIEEIYSINDLNNWDIFSDEIPVFFTLGSQDHPEHLKFLSDFQLEKEFIKYLELILSKKRAIFLGFSEEEFNDINNVFNSNRQLNNIFVQDSCDYKKISLHITNDVTKLILNQTTFIKLLYKAYEHGELQDEDIELNSNQMPDWLYEIASNPTETQAIDLFLDRVLYEIENCNGDKNVLKMHIGNIKNAFNQIYNKKPHFIAFKKIYNQIIECSKNDLMTNEIMINFKKTIERIKYYQNQISYDIKIKADEFPSFPKSDFQIGLYGLSERVLSFLSGLSEFRPFSIESTLYVSECSPKRSASYLDDYNYCKKIIEKNIAFNLVVVSDIMMTNLIETKKINMLCFGVHAIFFSNNQYKLRNIYGTKLLVELAIKNSIPVYFVTESDKLIECSEKMENFNPDKRVYEIYRDLNKDIKYESIRNEEITLIKGCHIITNQKIIEVDNEE